MPAPQGNEFWKARSRHGRKVLWESPEEFREACYDYLQWVEQNPLFKQKSVVVNGELTHDAEPIMRAMSIAGICVFLGIVRMTWIDYRKKEGFSDVIEEIESIMHAQKFEGAAGGLLNANIIARDLGLKDGVEQTISGPNGGPVQTQYTWVGVGPSDDDEE